MKQTAPKYIYLVFSATQNGMGRMIRRVTGYRFNHVSVSLTAASGCMYSFARHYKDAPLYGGFVRETAQRFADDSAHAATVRVCAIPVNDAQHRRARQYLDSLLRRREQYIYNLASAATFPLGHEVRVPGAMTCIQFAIALLRRAAAPRSRLIPEFCTIRELESIYGRYAVYDGSFTASPIAVGSGDIPADDYLTPHSLSWRVGATVKNTGRLVHRMLHKRKITPVLAASGQKAKNSADTHDIGAKSKK